jgi:glucose-6-phosphate isomerase
MGTTLTYNATAAYRALKENRSAEIEPKLLAAREDVLGDVTLLRSQQPIPTDKEPLDAGFIDLPRRLLDDDAGSTSAKLLRRMETVAATLRDALDRVVVLGIGGSYMGARALFEALCHPYHNELDREARDGVPRVSFAGNNLDNDDLHGLLKLLQRGGEDPSDIRHRWGLVVISKSGGTLETAVAFRIVQSAIEKFYGPQSEEVRKFVVPITGDAGKLRDLAAAKAYEHVFPIPDSVGGRFSVFTPVGLLPAALLGLDVRQLLRGADDMTEQFIKAPPGENAVLDYTAACHLLETKHGRSIRVLSTWGSRLEAFGFWYDQLLAESLGKDQRGATPITVVNTRDLHSRGQQHQEGCLDKLITNVIVESPSYDPIRLPTSGDDQDQLNRLAGKSYPELLAAAVEGTNRAYADADRPTADIVIPRLDEYSLGQLLQMMMLATVLEGRLIGTNPYGQPGVEAYKNNMTSILEQH